MFVPAPPTVDDVRRAIGESRAQSLSRNSDLKPLAFERAIHAEFLRLCVEGTAPAPFWTAYSANQIRSVALAVAQCESNSVQCASWKADATAVFTEEELEVLKGIYVRSIQPMLAPHLRDILVLHMNTTTEVHASGFGDYVLSLTWLFYRVSFAPSLTQDGFPAVVAWVQALEQMRSRLQSENAIGPFLQLLLPMLTLSRYYVIVHRGSNKDGLGLLRVQISQSFSALAVALLSSHVDDSIDDLAKKLQPDLLKDLLPLFWRISAASLGALSSGVVKTVASPQVTLLEAFHSEHRLRADTKESNQVAAPEAAAISLQEQVHQARSWCSDGDAVQFALRTLANTEVLPVAMLAELLTGFRDAYARQDHSALVVAFSAAADVPPAIRELLEIILSCVDPNDLKQRAALDSAVDVVKTRLRDSMPSEMASGLPQESRSPNRQHNAPEYADPVALRLWQDDAELSVTDERGVIRGNAFGVSLTMNGGIW